MEGFFIVFEGIDGCGKRTQLQHVRDWIERNGYSVVSSSEPNDDPKFGSEFGKKIRAMLNGEIPRPENPLEFQRLYVLDRAHDIRTLIKPALLRGAVYLLERFTLSTYCYGKAAGTSFEAIAQLHDKIIGDALPTPDLTIFLDLEVDVALERLARSRSSLDIFEKKEFLLKVRANYHGLTLPDRYNGTGAVAHIDANQPELQVFSDISAAIKEKMVAEHFLLSFA